MVNQIMHRVAAVLWGIRELYMVWSFLDDCGIYK